MTILDKLKAVFSLIFTIGPTILSDIEGSIKKIESDPTIGQKVHDSLDLLVEVLGEVAKLL